MNKVESSVRVIHIPTCIAVVSTEEKSQHLNKQKVLKRLQVILEIMKKDIEVKQVNQAWRASKNYQRESSKCL